MGRHRICRYVLRNKILWRRLYAVFASMSFLMYFFGHPAFGLEKLFYIPCGLALFSSIFCRFKLDGVDMLLCLMVILAVASAVINRNLTLDFTSPTIRFILGILCFNPLRKSDKEMIVRQICVWSLPVIIGFFLIEIPFVYLHRYLGYTGDPNYLAIGLTILTAINMYGICLYHQNIWMKAGSMLVLTGAFLIVLATMSRIGLIGMLCLYQCFFYGLLKNRIGRRPAIFLILMTSIVMVALLVWYAGDYPFYRFSMDDKSGLVSIFSRVDQVWGVLRYFSVNLADIFLGIGFDAEAVHIPEYGLYARHCVHNTFFCSLFHSGILGFVAFVLFVGYAVKCVHAQTQLRTIGVGLLIALILNMNSIPSLTSLLFWWGFFFVMSDVGHLVANKPTPLQVR